MTVNPFEFRVTEAITEAFSRSLKNADNSTAKLNPFRVEELLNQSMGLLDRCIENRDRIFDFEERKEVFRLDFDEAQAEYQIATAEIANSHTNSERIFQLEKELHDELHALTKAAAEFGKKGVERRADGAGERVGFVELASKLAGDSAYSNNAVVADHAKKLQEMRFDFELLDSWMSSVQAKALEKNYGTRFETESSKWKLAEATRVTREARAKLSFARFDELARLAAEPGNPLNFHERSVHAAKILEADFSEAIMRTRTAAVGLRQVYDLDEPYPDDSSPAILDDLSAWTRRSMVKLSQVTQRDFRETTLISLRSKYPDNDSFKEVLASGTFEFDLTTSDFDGRKLQRVRGIDACYVSSAGSPFYVSLTVKKVDHTNPIVTPEVTLQTVRRLSDFYDPDYRHSDQVFNFSPVGKWIVAIEKRTSDMALVEDVVEDLLISLDVVVQNE